METTNQSEKETMENNVPEKKSKKKLFIIAGVLGSALTIAIIYFIIAAGYESTDNAQLDADIVSIKASVFSSSIL